MSILDKFKDKLPFLKKKQSSEEDATGEYDLNELNAEEEIIEEDSTQEIEAPREEELKDKAKWEVILEKQLPFLYKLVKKIPLDKLKKGKKENKEKSSDASSPKAKKKIKPIHLIIGLGIGYLIISELTSEPEEVVEPAPPVNKPKFEIKKVKKEPQPTEETPIQAKEPQLDPAPTPAPAPSVEPEVSLDEDVVEPQTPLSEDEIEAPSIEPEEEVIVSEDPSSQTQPSTEPEPESELEVEVETDHESETIDSPENAIEEDVEIDSEPNQAFDQSLLETLEKQAEGALKPQEIDLTKKVEFSMAPDYEDVGRTLVYNCKGGHWACVDDDSFKSCQNNYAWNKQNKKKIECYPKEVYKTTNDCSRAQTMAIDNIEKTDFCKN